MIDSNIRAPAQCIIEFIKIVAERDKMLDKRRILSLFPNLFNKFTKI